MHVHRDWDPFPDTSYIAMSSGNYLLTHLFILEIQNKPFDCDDSDT